MQQECCERCLAVMLVLASHHTQVYRNARQVWKKYMNCNPNIKVFFVYGRDECNELEDRDSSDLVYDDIPEGLYPGMLQKTVRAIEELHRKYTYDYFIRTNISTFWDLSRLEENLARLPKEKCYYGNGPLHYGSIGYYLSGTDTIVDRDMITQLLANKQHLDYTIAEDAALGYVFHHVLGAPLLPSNMHFMENFISIDEGEKIIESIVGARSDYSQISPPRLLCDHFRVKSAPQCRATMDLCIYKKLLKIIYDIEINY